MHIYLATNEGVVTLTATGEEWAVKHRTLAGRHVTTIIAREGVILAGTERGIYRSDDGAETWEEASSGLRLPHVRWLAYHPDVSDLEFAGTEPAAIFISTDGGATWQERPEVTELRRHHGWYLPYSPEAGCIRGFAFHGDRGYAAAEDGAVLRSDDRGHSWALAPGSAGDPLHNPGPGQVHSDAHSITVHPRSPELVVAPTGGGLFFSEDGGVTWENRYRCYCRAVWWDPGDPRHLIFGPADGVDRQGRIEESHDGGKTWHSLNQGSNAPWPRHMVERFYPSPEQLFAVLSNGDLLVSPLSTISWRRLPGELGWVNDLAGP